MNEYDLRLAVPPLLDLEPMILSLQTDTKPTVGEDGSALQIGQELWIEESGYRYWWNGTAWILVTVGQKIDRAVELLKEIRDLLLAEDD